MGGAEVILDVVPVVFELFSASSVISHNTYKYTKKLGIFN